MKVASFLLATLLTGLASAQTARDYYNELNRTNGLEGLSNEYVCFKDEATDDVFFTISKGNDIKQGLLLMNADAKKMKTSDISFSMAGNWVVSMLAIRCAAVSCRFALMATTTWSRSSFHSS